MYYRGGGGGVVSSSFFSYVGLQIEPNTAVRSVLHLDARGEQPGSAKKLPASGENSLLTPLSRSC